MQQPGTNFYASSQDPFSGYASPWLARVSLPRFKSRATCVHDVTRARRFTYVCTFPPQFPQTMELCRVEASFW
jgi:hypothetical protein